MKRGRRRRGAHLAGTVETGTQRHHGLDNHRVWVALHGKERLDAREKTRPKVKLAHNIAHVSHEKGIFQVFIADLRFSRRVDLGLRKQTARAEQVSHRSNHVMGRGRLRRGLE